MRPSTKYQNVENDALFVPIGNAQSPKSILLLPKDDAAPCTCQLPTITAFVGIAYETAAFVVTLSTRHPRIMLSIVAWTGFTSVAILPIPNNPVNPA